MNVKQKGSSEKTVCREVLYQGLRNLGFSCIKPEGAFYLFMKSPVADEKQFCEAAKKYHVKE